MRGPGRGGRGLSLRVKITAAFVLIVVGGTAVSTTMGSRIITDALLNQARVRVRYGLKAAGLVYAERSRGVESAVERTAASERLVEAIRAADDGRIARELAATRSEAELDFLGYLPAEGAPVLRAAGSSARSPLGPGVLRQAAAEALAGQTVAATEVLPAAALAAEDPALAARAHLPIVAVPRAASDARTEVGEGLALIAAAPVVRRGKVIGALYGGVVLSGDSRLVDHIKTLIYGGEKYGGSDIGAVSIVLGDVRAATNVLNGEGARAVGTRVSAEVSEAVLGRGTQWFGRAFVVNGWYITAYEPLRDQRGAVVGMLSVGMRESPYLAVRSDVMASFLVLVVFGLMVVLGLTYVLTRTMIHPLEEMVAATKRIAGGDLDSSVAVRSHDEVGHLADSFNRMTVSLRGMQDELQQWARTLEEKVRERTEELVAVQARMAQSEKLASIGRLAAGVAHEINNPLGGILSIAMLGLEDCGEEHPMRRDLEIIVRQTLRCREIVKGLLEFSRQSETRATRVDVNAIADQTLSLLERQALFHNIRTRRRFRDDLPPVLIDPGQLQQVVMNIVINAVDAMEESGALEVSTDVDAGHGEVVLTIQDTGRGIPADVMPFIFEPFFTTKKVGKGTGLGLAIVHGIITRAGGRVEATSGPGGTTFLVRLPIAGPGSLDDELGEAPASEAAAVHRRGDDAGAGAARSSSDSTPRGSSSCDGSSSGDGAGAGEGAAG